MYVPHAVDVDGQIITMFDPVNHQRAAATDGDDQRRRQRIAGSALGDASAVRSWSSAAS